MAVVGYFVGEIGNLRFERGIAGIESRSFAGVIESGVMFDESFTNFPCEIQAGEVGILLFELLDNAETVVVVFEAAWPFIKSLRTVSPLCPNGEWPRSCARAIVSARSSFNFNARVMFREIAATSIVCVRRVRK